MIAVIQRVSEASVTIGNQISGSMAHGLLVLLGIEENDTTEDIEWLSKKIINLRIFNDGNDVMNLDLLDVKGDLMIVSQFTLHASTKKGNRPSYTKAARPEVAVPLYDQFIETVEQKLGVPVKTGEFGAMMKVGLINDGPVTIIIDTKDKK